MPQGEILMKKFLTLLLTLVMALTACVGLTACNDNSEPEVITVGYTLYEPMNYKDENGKLTGFDTELAEKVFGELGYTVRFKLIDWNNKYLELDNDTINCIWNGFTANSAEKDGTQRNQLVDFSVYYMQNAQCIVKKSATASLSAWDQTATKSVAYEAGSAADSLVTDNVGETTLTKPVLSQMDAIKEVNLGTTDYAVVDILLAKSICGKGDFADLVIDEGMDLGIEYYAVGFKKGSDLTAKVNDQFAKLTESGFVQQLAAKYKLENALLLGRE